MKSGNGAGILDSCVRVPDEVVYRSFAKETVVLNLATGQYHGLNPTAARMLDVLGASSSVSDAAVALSREYSRPLAQIQEDLAVFCETLVARGLLIIEVGPVPDPAPEPGDPGRGA